MSFWNVFSAKWCTSLTFYFHWDKLLGGILGCHATNILVLLSPKYHFPKVPTTDFRKFTELTSREGNFCQRHLLLLHFSVATTPCFPVTTNASMSWLAWLASAPSFCPNHSLTHSLETALIPGSSLHAFKALGGKDFTEVQLAGIFCYVKINFCGQTIIIARHHVHSQITMTVGWWLLLEMLDIFVKHLDPALVPPEWAPCCPPSRTS